MHWALPLLVGRVREVRLQLVPGDVPTDTALISNTLWWNLGLPNDTGTDTNTDTDTNPDTDTGTDTGVTLRPLTQDQPPVARVAPPGPALRASSVTFGRESRGAGGPLQPTPPPNTWSRAGDGRVQRQEGLV